MSASKEPAPTGQGLLGLHDQGVHVFEGPRPTDGSVGKDHYQRLTSPVLTSPRLPTVQIRRSRA